MAKAGLSFENPLYQKTGASPLGTYTPFAPPNTASASGSDALQNNLADLAALGDAGVTLARTNRFNMPQMRKPPAIAFSPSKNQFFVQGQMFAGDDFASALQSEALLNQPGVDLPQGDDWIEIDQESYSGLLKNIRQPTFGTLASKSFGRGVDVSQALAGRGLQLAGAEELGGRIVAAQEEELRKTSPFERQFTDIESGRDAVEWFVANFAQQGPNMIESVITAGLGFLAGSAVGGPAAGVGGAFAGMMGKTAFKESVKAAAKKKAAGQTLTAAENKLLREAAGIAGAVTASYTQNLATGAADLYGELRESGADADDVDARIKALAGAVPYAALETLPEYLLASRIFSGVGTPAAIPAGTSVGRRGAILAGRGLTGAAVGGLAEGTTEVGQEILGLGISGQDIGSDENRNRLINAFAAGFGVGGAIGGVANLRGKAPANLLNPSQSTEPSSTDQKVTDTIPQAPPRLPLVVAPGTQGELFGQVAPTSPIPGLQPLDTEAAAPPFGITPATEVPVTQMDLFDTGQVQADMFGGPPALVGPQQLPAAPIEAVPAAPAPLPGQLPFQFAPEAPTGIGFTERQPVPQTEIARQLEALRRQQEFDQAMAQRREAETTQAEAQRQLQLAQPPAAPVAPVEMPTVPVTERQPQQLPLFGTRGLPRPSGAERLRRGMEAPTPAAKDLEAEREVLIAERDALMRGIEQFKGNRKNNLSKYVRDSRQRVKEIDRRLAQLPAPKAPAGQLDMFTTEGEPTLTALKSAGKRQKVPPPVEEKGGKQRPPTGRNVTPESIAKARARVKTSGDKEVSYGDGSRYVGWANKDDLPDGVGTLTFANGIVQTGTFKDGQLVQGTQTDTDGTVLEGTFKDGVFIEGTQTDADGTIFKVKDGEVTETTTKIAEQKKLEEGEPVEITLELDDGGRMMVKDGRKLLDKLNNDIGKYERFLACLTRK